MRELKARLQGLDAAQVPDLWPDAQQRTPRAQPEPPPRLGGTHARRAVAILLTTLVVLGAVLYGLSGLGSSTSGPATNPTASNLESYVNPMGIPIALDYPSDWYAQSVSQDSNPNASATGRQQVGVVISNIAEAMPSPHAAAPSPGPLPENPNLPQNYVSLSILYLVDPCGSTGGCRPGLLRPNSPLPLSMSDAKVAPGLANLAILEATVAMHNLTITLQAGPEASSSDLARADAIVASIRPTEATPSPSHSPTPTDAASGRVPTCAPNGEPWASAACPESVWLRKVTAAAGAKIIGLTSNVEPQPKSAFLVSYDGYTFSMGAVSKEDLKKMGGYFTMGEFGAGMPQAGTVSGVTFFGDVDTGHWSWTTSSGFTVEIYPAEAQPTHHVPRSVAERLIQASLSAG